jgi:hypothetical protein
MRQQDMNELELESASGLGWNHGARRNSGPGIVAKIGLKVFHRQSQIGPRARGLADRLQISRLAARCI